MRSREGPGRDRRRFARRARRGGRSARAAAGAAGSAASRRPPTAASGTTRRSTRCSRRTGSTSNDKDYPAGGPAPPFQTVSGVVQRDAARTSTRAAATIPSATRRTTSTSTSSVDSAGADLVGEDEHERRPPRRARGEPRFRPTSGRSRATASRCAATWVWDCDHFTARIRRASPARRRSSIPGRRSGSSARSPRAAGPGSGRSISTSRATRPRPASRPTARTARSTARRRSRRASSWSRGTPT